MEAEAEAEEIFENHLEADAEAEAEVEVEVEANFFSSWKRKQKLLNSIWRVEVAAEAVKNFWKFHSAFYVWVEVFHVLSFFF